MTKINIKEKKKQMELSYNEFFNWFLYDNGKLYWKKSKNGKSISKEAGCLRGNYHIIGFDGYDFYRSHLVWFYFTKKFPPQSMTIDHINHIKNDDRIENLRVVSHAVNCTNLPLLKSNSSKVTGVHLNKRKTRWVAQIQHKRKTIYLGTFKNKEQAIIKRYVIMLCLGFHYNHGISTISDINWKKVVLVL